MKKNLLFVYPFPATFIQLDIKILSEEFNVYINTYNWKNKKLTPFYLIRQFFYLICNTYRFPNIVVSFGGYWSFLPALFGKIFGKKTYIILHGTDCAAFEEINYGSLRKQPLRQFCKWSYYLAYKLLPVSESLIYNENSYFEKGKIVKQGYKHFFPSVDTPVKVIPNGFEIQQWLDFDSISIREPNSFISVVSGESQFHIKGIDLILEVSKNYLNCNFYIAGYSDTELKYDKYKNVHFLGYLPHSKLKEYYYKSEYYLQLSIIEGFGCALCEAMLCGCIPIVSVVNNLPKIIGDSGYLLKNKDLEELNNLIRKILSQPTNYQYSSMAKNQIVYNYNIDRRKKDLFNITDADRPIKNYK